MKKATHRLLSLCLLLLLGVLTCALTCTMTACGSALRLHLLRGEEQALYLFQAVNENAAKATSATVEQTLYLKLRLNGIDYEQTTSATVTDIGQGEDRISITRIRREISAGDSHTVTYNDSGYVDGMMFSYYGEGDIETKIKSVATAAQFDDFNAEQKEDDPEIAVGEGYANAMSCQKNSDGTWTAAFEEFTETGMASFWEMLAGVESMVTAEHALADVRMTCTADKALNLTSLSIEYIFEENPETENPVPVVRIDFAYSDWNATSLAEPYDLSDFTEVEDVRYVDRFLGALENRQTAEAGSLTVVNEMSAETGDKSQRQNAVQTVVFDMEDGYRFTAKTLRASYDTIITYRDGLLTSEVRDHESGSLMGRNEEAYTDYEAQSAIQQFMNSEEVRGIDLASATLVSAKNDLYRFDLGESVRKKLDLRYQATYGTSLETFEGYVEATVKDGELVSYDYHYTISFSVAGLPMTVTATTSVTFDTPTEGGSVV